MPPDPEHQADRPPLAPPASPSAPSPQQERLAAFGATLADVMKDPDAHALFLSADFATLLSMSAPGAGSADAKLVDTIAPALRALDDEDVRRAFLLDYLQGEARTRAERASRPFVPWDDPRKRETQVSVNALDARSDHYRAWLAASLADVAGHFARALTNETDDIATANANLAIARMLRAAVLASGLGHLKALDDISDEARLYLQRATAEKGLVLSVPERRTGSANTSSSTLHGDPPGSVVLVPGGDVVGRARHKAAQQLWEAMATRLRDGFTEDERAAIIEAVPTAVPRAAGPISDEEIVLGAWWYFRLPLFHVVIEDLPQRLPLEPSAELLATLTAVVIETRKMAAAKSRDAEDAAEDIIRALLLALGCPSTKVRSLFDPLRKKPRSVD
jgi:hypothetical protein